MPLSSAQQEVVDAAQRFKVIVAGRRFGKTFLSINRLCYEARIPDRTVWYVAPTYKQAKMIAFKALKRKLTDLRWLRKSKSNKSTSVSLRARSEKFSVGGMGLCAGWGWMA